MNTQQLVDLTKLRLDDETVPRNFQDNDILSALNDAQDEFAFRTLCLFDGTSKVSVQAQSPWVTFPDGTIWLTAAWIDTNAPLTLVTQHQLELGYFELNGVEASTRYSNWRNAEGTPQFLITDLGPSQGRLVARPTAGGDLFLERYRYPAAKMKLTAVNPEIPTHYHTDLVVGALAFLFSIPDEETYDAGMAAEKRNAWETRLQIAEQRLQTAFRVQLKVIPPPPGIAFAGVVGNTIGAAQNVNTQS